MINILKNNIFLYIWLQPLAQRSANMGAYKYIQKLWMKKHTDVMSYIRLMCDVMVTKA